MKKQNAAASQKGNIDESQKPQFNQPNTMLNKKKASSAAKVQLDGLSSSQQSVTGGSIKPAMDIAYNNMQNNPVIFKVERV